MKVTIAPRTGLELKNPVIAASGTFGYGTEFASRMDISGLGGLVCKGTTREPRAGNRPLRIAETAAGILNAIGLQNIGVEAVVTEKAPIWSGWSLPVFVNVAATNIDDYVYVVSKLDAVTGISGVELNISSPSLKQGGAMFGGDPKLAAEVTHAVRQVTDLPLMVKLSPNIGSIREIAAAVEEAGADAISVMNTLFAMAIDIDRRRPKLDPILGGLSGPAIKPHALYLVYEVAQEVSIPVVGIGGITTSRDAVEFLLAGATAVQLGTALLVDPTIWQEVVEGLESWCRDEGVTDWGQVIGVANAGFKGGGTPKKKPPVTKAGGN